MNKVLSTVVLAYGLTLCASAFAAQTTPPAPPSDKGKGTTTREPARDMLRDKSCQDDFDAAKAALDKAAGSCTGDQRQDRDRDQDRDRVSNPKK